MTEPIGRASTGRSEVALTYDDGPGPATGLLLDLLAKRDARATFFMVGSQVDRDPATARSVFAAGHAVASHSMRHLDHDEVSAPAAVADMVEGAAAIERALGAGPQLYRAPYGHFAAATLDEAARRGWQCVAWTVIGEDWRPGETGHSIARRVTAAIAPGAIIALHDGRREQPCDPRPVLEASALILDECARRDLRPVTVPVLLAD